MFFVVFVEFMELLRKFGPVNAVPRRFEFALMIKEELKGW